MFKLFRWVAIVVLSIMMCVPAISADDPEPEADEVNVIVTAERTSQPVSESISSATVVTAKDIKEKGAQTAADAIRSVPGVTIVQNGELGSLAAVKIRGTSSAQTLVMIDGKRLVSSAFGGNVDLSKIPVDNIARIEIIRGPVSSLYGSDAIGGVINIITKKPTANRGELTMGYGSNDRASRSLALFGVVEDAAWQISASVPKYSGSRPNSAFQATDLSGSISFPEANGWDISLSGNIYNDKLGLPGSISFSSLNDTQWWKRRSFELSVGHEVAGGQMEVKAYQLKQSLKEINPDWFTDSLISGNTNIAELTYNKSFGSHNVVLGAEYRDEDYEDIEYGMVAQDKNTTNKAFYIQDRMPVGSKADLVIGARYDDHSTAGEDITPRIGITREFGKDTHLRLSYSEGFRAPSLVELYYNNFGSYGNPDLEPEKSRQYELGLNTKWGDNEFDIAYFTGKLRNQIAFILVDPVYFTGTFENLERTKQRGVEFSWNRPIGKSADIAVSYTYTDALNIEKNSQISGIPYNQAGVTISKQLTDLNIALTGRYVGERMFSTVKSASFTVFDLYLGMKRPGSINPYLMIRNLGDKTYDEVAGYPAEGRSYEIGIRSSW